MKLNIHAFAIILALGLLAASPVLAQSERPASLRANPYRDIGGSCVYGKQGEVLYAPKGAQCTDRSDHLAATGQTSEKGDRFQALPPAYRPEANALVRDHAHIAAELGQLREMIARDKRESALEISDKVVRELNDHLTREERFLDKLSAEHATH